MDQAPQQPQPAEEQPQEQPQPEAQPEVEPKPQDDPNAPNEVPVQPAQQEAPPQPQQPEQPVEEDDNEVDIPTFNMPQQYEQYRPPEPQPQPQQQAPPPTQQQGIPNLDPSGFTDQYGNVDMMKFSQAMQTRDQALVAAATQQVIANVIPQVTQAATQQVVAAKQEERLWESAFKKHPELRDSKELRDTVHKYRMGTIAAGGNESPVKAADRLFKFIGAARDQGAKDATQTVKVQASAHLETSDNTASEDSVRQSELASRVGSPNRSEAKSARNDLIKEWFKSGHLKLPD